VDKRSVIHRHAGMVDDAVLIHPTLFTTREWWMTLRLSTLRYSPRGNGG
jgi:hypothetical protein